MRGFIVLCLCAVALAAPQGYNYNQGQAIQQQQAATGFGGSFGGSNFISSATSNSGSAGFFQGGQAIQQQAFGGHQQQQQVQQHQEAVVSKRFFIHTAPEENDEEFREKLITVGVPKKNYNVVFIKNPAKSSKKTAIKISPAPTEEKTVIYVLSKKTDGSDVQAEVIEHPTSTAKPEVFFIKYKTNEEAYHAQQQIQAQYDSLGGSSQVTDEGVAPVTSVVGSLNGGADAGAAAAGGAAISQGGNGGFSGIATNTAGHATASGNGNAYLPPNFY